MRYAVALTMEKNNGSSTDIQTRLSFHYDCQTKEQALGEAVIDAQKAYPKYSLLFHLVGEIGPDPKPDSTLEKLLEALGWEGGTIHQALEGVRVLKTRVAQLEEAWVDEKMREDRDQLLAQNSELIAKVDELMKVLSEEASQLEQWAVESREGGWSTHQVDPMRKRASMIRALIAAYKGKFNHCPVCLCISARKPECPECGHAFKPQGASDGE